MKTQQEMIDYYESYRNVKLGIGEVKDFENKMKEYYSNIKNINIEANIHVIGYTTLPYNHFYTFIFNIPVIFECGFVRSREGYTFKESKYNYATLEVGDYIDLMIHCVLLKETLTKKYNKYHGYKN